MMTPVTIWFCIAAFVAALIFVRTLIAISRFAAGRHHRHIFELGSEREEFWIPGDYTANEDPEEFDD